MLQSLLPVLVLTTVALSTSDVLPILSIKQIQPEIDSSEDQLNENTLDNKYRNTDSSNNVFYKVSIEPHDAYAPVLPQKSNIVYYRDNDQSEDIGNDRIGKKDKYDEKGFRKEQWHNYPRQLDRLQKYLYRHHQFDTLTLEPDREDDIAKNIYEIGSDEINRPNNKNAHDIMDAVVAATSPLLILKIRLAYLKNDLQSTNLNEDADTEPIELVPNSIIYENDQEEIDPIISAVKVKREGISNTKRINYMGKLTDKATDNKKTVNKRIFSLWSRLQSLSHKGHELHHRRHLHAFYGFPDDDGSGGSGGGTLTAETRASFIRPPGSPLRWG